MTKKTAKKKVTKRKVQGDFARWLKESRTRLKMTQAEFSQHVGIPTGMIGHWENRLYSPSQENVDKLITALKLPPEHGFMLHLMGARAAGWKV